MKILTVITVTYNAEKTLERTLNSVQEQTYPYLEHLIVDGGSQDGTVELIRKYAAETSIAQEKRSGQKKITWISEPDRGLYDAMNKAIKISVSDYLCFLNSGDTFFSPDTVKRMMLSSDTDKSPDILYGETAIVDDKGNFLYMRRLQNPEKLTWKSFKQGMLVCHQAFIVKRELVEPYNLSYRFSSDFDWCIRMMKKTSSIHNTRLILINYLNEGMTTANRKASLIERYRIMVKYYGHLSTFFHHIWFVIRAVLK